MGAVRIITLVLLVWGIELALGLGGLALAQVHPSATLFWPVIGFDLAFLLQFGARVLPIIWVGAFAMNIVTFGTFVTCIIIASGNVAKVYVASKLFGGGRYSGHHFTRFVVSCFPAAVIGGTIGTAALVLNDYKSGFGLHEFWLYIIEHWSQGDHAGLLAFVTWMNWIVGDFLGMIIFTPIFETYLVKIKKRVGYA